MGREEKSGGTKASQPQGASEPSDASKAGEELSVASDAATSEEAALRLLKEADAAVEVLERMAKNGGLLKHRKVKLALVGHPKTPRHVSLPLVRQLYTFDLMQVALTPSVPADVKLAADDALCNRLNTIASGERLTLAHRGSARVAGELLLDAEPRVAEAALQNSRLTEASVVRALMRPEASAAFVEAVASHPQWSLRQEVRVALLRNEKTPLDRAVEFVRALPARQVREIVEGAYLPESVQELLLKELDQTHN